MASKGINMALVMVLVVMLCGSAAAQSTSCTSALIGLSSCLNYITGNSSTPSSSCCSQLASVVQGQPQCLCSVLGSGGSSLGISINQTQALALPGACKVQTPPISQCNTGNGPTSSAPTPASEPVGSPADSSNDTPQVPSGSGSKTVPSTNSNTSGGSNIKVPYHLVLFVLFIASCASTSTRF